MAVRVFLFLVLLTLCQAILAPIGPGKRLRRSALLESVLSENLGGCPTYAVKSGDICWNIAENHQISVAQLESYNPGVNCDDLQIGQSLCVGPAPATSPAAFASFAGSNLYYAAGLTAAEQKVLFTGLQSAGVKVLRVWLDGESSASSKGTSFPSYPSLEPNQVGVYDDTVLKLLDGVMITAHSYGIKLLISMHSFNALSGGDVYGQTWGTGYFYEQQSAFTAFDNRLKHVLTHTHTTLGKQWKDLSQYIFAFEAQNEAMIGKGASYIAAHQSWQCDRATTIKSVLGQNSGILVTTGGESWMDESIQPDWWSCAALDVIAIHAYGVGDFNTTKIQAYVKTALSSGKKLLFQEWGACYYTTENNDCSTGSVLDPNTRAANIKNWANQISSAGVPWLYWQIVPNADPHYGSDYEIGIGDANWNTFQSVASGTKNYKAAFDYSKYLL